MAKKMILSVEEAEHRDVGRSIARIDRENMQKLDLISGDIIEIKGKKLACAIVWPGYPADSKKKIIRIDGDTRNNASVGIDDKATITKTEASLAKKITIAPTNPIRIIKGSEYLQKVLKGRPIINGERVRVEMLGGPITFTIISTKPSGPVIVADETVVVLKEKAIEEAEKVQITYEDIGGLEKEIKLVREMVELPLRHPELFQEIGIEPPKGVLLYGPPGTGKTLLAKAVANESEANFFSIKGPEIVAKYYGESEERLRELFAEAESSAPAIIFIDEIDSIAPKRGEMSGEKQVERRIVSQLLSLMDGLKARGEIIVIAATNQPDILDEALRRGGRFDREIEIGVPDKKGRKEMLDIHTRGMPLADEVDLDYFASITHGFVGADITLLCKEAGMQALRKILPEIDINKKIPLKVIDNLKISKQDFYEAMKSIEPSAMREICIEIPKVKWSDVGGLEEAKRELIEAVKWPLKYPALFEYAHIENPKGILLYGPPGTGKTLLAKAVANESEINFISIKGPEIISKYVGESEKKLRDIFRKSKQVSPCILFFDELDAIVPMRGANGGDGGMAERFISQLLTEMDGVEALRDVLVLGATNRKDLIDVALLRPGRFDKIIFIPLPDEKTREEIIKIHSREKPLAKNVNLISFAKKTKGFSGADIQAICSNAAKLAIREFVKKRKESEVEKEVKQFKIEPKHFEEAFEEAKSKKEKEEKREVKTVKDGQKILGKISKEDMMKLGMNDGNIIETGTSKKTEKGIVKNSMKEEE